MQTKSIQTLLFILLFQLSAMAQDQPEFELGGALRFNYNYSTWKSGHGDRGGDFGFDVFRLNPKASYKGVRLDAEYRFYAAGFGGGFLKHGWMAYDFTPASEIQLGLVGVAFGNAPYDGHSFFFNLGYYVGLEDQYDMGIKWIYRKEHYNFELAFLKNSEEYSFGSESELNHSRYAYDVVGRNKEVNKINARYVLKLGANKAHHLGVSGQYGGLYNLDSKEMGQHYSFAAHYNGNVGRWNLHAQALHYKKTTAEPNEFTIAGAVSPQNSADYVEMGAFGAPYNVAAEASIYSAGIAYNLPVKWGPISGLQFYNDYSYMDKAVEEWSASVQNILGTAVMAGPIYAYFDLAWGKNQPWLGSEWTNALTTGDPNADWEMRFNINLGYYF